jgi:hypothetical protein
MPPEPLRWKKSSSGQETCVELAHTLTAVRDSKHPASVLTLDAAALVTMARAGKLDR